MDVRIYEGWPTSDQLDLDVGGKVEVPDVTTNPITTDVILRKNGPAANVSIFPLVGTGNAIYQIQNQTYVITPAAIGLTVTTSGQPGASVTARLRLQELPKLVSLLPSRQTGSSFTQAVRTARDCC